MRDWLSMKWAHIQDALAIWDGSYLPCAGNRVFYWLKVKASICIALGWEDFFPESEDEVLVWASAPVTYHGFDGPGQSWSEVSVSLNRWAYRRYSNGI
jgi:hypothetical protein